MKKIKSLFVLCYIVLLMTCSPLAMCKKSGDNDQLISLNNGHELTLRFNDLYDAATQAIIDRDETHARAMVKQSRQLASQLQLPEIMLRSYVLLIKVNSAFFDLPNWLKEIKSGLEFCTKNQQDQVFMKHCEATIKNQLAKYYAHINDYESAIKTYQQANILAKNGDDYALIVDIVKSIGNLYNVIDQGDRAIEYFEQAIELGLSHEIEEIGPIVATMVNAAFIYDDTEQFDKALETVTKGLLVMQSNNYNNGIISAFFHNIAASSHLGKNHIKAARLQINKSFASYKKIGEYPFLKNVITYTDARITWAEGDEQQAMKIMDNMAMLLLESKDENSKPDWLMYVLKTTADYHKKMQNHQRSAYFYEQYAQYIKSHLTVNLNRTIAVLQNELDFQKQQQALSSTRISLANQRLIVDRQKNVIVLVLVISAAILVILLLYWRSTHRHKAINQKLTDSNKKLSTALNDREMLIKEVNHRVKNNLQLISSLINLQRRRNNVEDHNKAINDRDVLREVQGRVETIALIHNELYRTDDIQYLNVGHLLDKISGYIVSLFPYKVNIVKQLNDIHIGIDAAIPIGLIACEVINNAIKHGANNDRQLTIDLQLKDCNLGWQLTISDNGPGFDAINDVDYSRSLGMVLITSMSEQIKAAHQFSNIPGSGTQFKLMLKT